jgi:hypothetical protein
MITQSTCRAQGSVSWQASQARQGQYHQEHAEHRIHAEFKEA